ncbi:class I SAM-dependent methyltransferase [Chitinophaga nivalis]|uniref:Class I SAM-dependent methyltransferase n=1 Tax=Chitinophaga nivalis TaxID=2991709 RepID=A0ABT3IN11_9BACT|nr:class I SAM-dependent methyltransferase [Chitinophaga nivalis]MCW3464960.1 class I SAM-dependent methyltransferase [Chitinophaga nivalis]MCW3485348.1 class I SAM-dependent methyltransferase [Chitinophaga nivalis]
MTDNTVTPWEKQFYDPALFDAAAGDAYSDEAEALYFKLIGNVPRKIIEFGCGTGRVILKLAAAGHLVTGVDISPTMLSHLEQKISHFPPDKRTRINTICAAGGEVELHDKFQIVMAVDDFLTHFLQEEELTGMLRQIASCLEPEGYFITDLRIRDAEKISRAQKKYPKDINTYGLVHGVQVGEEAFSAAMKYWEDYDATSNILCSHQIFDFIRQDGQVEKTVYKTLRQKLLTHRELTAMAEQAALSLHRFIPFDEKDNNAGIYMFQLKAYA